MGRYGKVSHYITWIGSVNLRADWQPSSQLKLDELLKTLCYPGCCILELVAVFVNAGEFAKVTCQIRRHCLDCGLKYFVVA